MRNPVRQRVRNPARNPTIALVSVAVAAVAFATTANADETTYLDHLHKSGIMSSEGDASLTRAGWDICDMVSRGASPESVAAGIVYYTGKTAGDYGLEPQDADVAVGYALTDLCPAP